LHYLATLALLGIFFHTGVMASSFQKLGLSSTELGYAMMFAILLSLVNIQLFSLRPARAEADAERVRIGVNLGGCVVPLFFCLYLLSRFPLEPLSMLLLVAAVSMLVYPLSRVEGRRGLVIHLAGAILGSAVGAWLLVDDHYLVAAYCAGVLGTLIGGDLLHLTQLRRLRSAVTQGVFIGGAGLMDAIFLSGIFALFAAEALQGALQPVGLG
jgi:uncharacterized membrane protein